ncbi:hypothetical protein ACHAQH_001796 [Verticillium albo-atrum]
MTNTTPQAAALPTENTEVEDQGIYFEPPYPLVDAEWDIEVFPGAEAKHFVGTIETVTEEILTLNPKFLEDFESKTTVTEDALGKRDPSGGPVCFDHTQGANMLRFQEGTFYLDRLNRYLDIAPRRCSRVSCSFNAGIAICNDSPSTTWSLHTSIIVSYVQRISRECSHFSGSSMAGQQFDTGGWNVIAVNMNCNANSGWNVGIWPPRK